MENRKLFRMKHQPCSGHCYAPDDVLALRELGLDVEPMARLLVDLIEIHEPACGREQITFALDYCEHSDIFVAVFVHFGAIETYAAKSPVLCLRQLIDGARKWYATDDARALLQANPGDGKDACEHGSDDALARFALKYSGLADDVQAQVQARVSVLLAA